MTSQDMMEAAKASAYRAGGNVHSSNGDAQDTCIAEDHVHTARTIKSPSTESLQSTYHHARFLISTDDSTSYLFDYALSGAACA
jgi:hypothetical protein